MKNHTVVNVEQVIVKIAVEIRKVEKIKLSYFLKNIKV
jgi:hypothetical protein